jgi:hypothetical protein
MQDCGRSSYPHVATAAREGNRTAVAKMGGSQIAMDMGLRRNTKMENTQDSNESELWYPMKWTGI